MEYYRGHIALFSFDYAPEGWLPCEGQILNVKDDAVLCAIFGTAYGGDGKNTFALPNLKGAEPHPNTKYYMYVYGLYPPKQ